MPTLDDLVQALGPDLLAVSSLPRAAPVSGVHVSELTDPTPYLEGGELLLTTGMCLTGQMAQARAYAARLARRGVAALGLGIGPVHAGVPEVLVQACEAVGLPLLVVPAPTPFLLVARTYWSLLIEAGKEELSAALGAHRDLVDAAAGPRPVPAVVRTLAGAVEGWAAQLGPGGQVLEVWPRSRRPSARRGAAEVSRLRMAGPHSSATFPLGDDDVVLHPLASGGRLTGFVVTGSPRPMRTPDRQLVLAACSLLALQSEQQRRGAAAARAARDCVARLVGAGHIDAARALAADLGLDALPSRVRVLCVSGGPGASGDDLVEALETSLPHGRQTLLARTGREGLWALVPDDLVDAVTAAATRLAGDPAVGVTAGLTAPLELAGLAAALPLLQRTVAALPTGTVRDLASAPDDTGGDEGLERLLAYRRADLLGAVVPYLRHRGHWERAAADLGVHRNTLRHRIGTACRVLGADLDDPDVASRTWLALRERGLA